MIRHLAAADGRRLAYRDSGGAGPAVLCLAGLTRNGRDFEALAAHLAPRFRVIRLDSRGRGASEHAADPLAEYAVPVETGDAIGLLDHLGLGRVAIVGTSRGGILGMGIAAAQPERVSALVLNDIGAAVELAGLTRIAAGIGRVPEAGSLGEAAEALGAGHAQSFPGVPPARWLAHARAILDVDGDGRLSPAHDPRLAEATAAALAPALEAGLEQVSLWPLFEALGALHVLVLRGANSDILSAATVAAMLERHPGLVAVEIADRGHAPFLDETAALAAIDRFLEEHA